MDLLTPNSEFKVIFEKNVFESLQIWIVIIISILLLCTIKRHKSTFSKLWCAYKTELLNESFFFKSCMCYRNLLRLSPTKTCICLEQWFTCSCSLSPGSIIAIWWNIPVYDCKDCFPNIFFCVCVCALPHYYYFIFVSSVVKCDFNMIANCEDYHVEKLWTTFVAGELLLSNLNTATVNNILLFLKVM